MPQEEQATIRWEPKDAAEREAVLGQVTRMVTCPLFSQSRRYPIFLRYIVEKTLAGESFQLKERTLGIDVLGRSPDYDSNADPIVRIIAGEIRKRIAQYYFQSGREEEIRIELPLGSYIPTFRLPDAYPKLGLLDPVPEPPVVATETPKMRMLPAVETQAEEPVRSSRFWMVIAVSCLLLAVTWLLWSQPWTDKSPLSQFWASTISGDGPVLICVALQNDLEGATPAATMPEPGPEMLQYKLDRWVNRLGISDATTLARVIAVLYWKKKDYRIVGDKTMTLDALRHSPTVLVGAFDNAWTMRLTRDLRFSFALDPAVSGRISIHDRLHPNRRDMEINNRMRYSEVGRDYGIVARYLDHTCDCTVVVAAGLGEYGTVAAGEFLSSETAFRELQSRAPKDWQSRNMEIVVSADVVNGNSGPPHVLEAEFW